MKFLRGYVSIILFAAFFLFGAINAFAESPWDKKDVDPNHHFTITFNQKVDPKSVNTHTIYVLDENGRRVEGKEPKVSNDGYKVIVEAPASGYSYGSSYILVVTKNVVSEKQQPLNKEIRMNFTIQEIHKTITGKVNNIAANTIEIQDANGIVSLPLNSNATYYLLQNGEKTTISNSEFIEKLNHHSTVTYENHNGKESFTLQVSSNPATPSDGLKEQIEKAMLERQTKFSIQYVGDLSKLEEKVIKALDEILAENEYLNYDFKGYSLDMSGSGNEATIDFKVNYYQTKEQAEYVEKRVKEILADIIDPSMNDHEKVKAVHDYVVTHIAYDESLNQAVNAPYFALTNGKTLCNGYAMLVYLMLDELDIPVRLISGESRGNGHAWNLVQLDGKWYHLDATWDDPIPDQPGRVMYHYYLLSDSEIRHDHSWKDGGLNGREQPYPAANTNYLEVLMERGDMELIESLGLQYLTPDYTVDETNLAQFLNEKILNKENRFTFRFVTNQSIDKTAHLIREAIRELGIGGSLELMEYSRTQEKDYLVTVNVFY